MAVSKSNLFLYFLICNFIISSVRGEPQCSKFPYEEALLEKMVRMEFKLEQMEKGFKDMERSIVEERRQLQDDEANLKELIETSIKDSESKLNGMETEVKQIGEKILKDVQDATSALEVSREQNEAKLVRLSEDMRKFKVESLSDIKGPAKAPDVFFKAKDLVSRSVSSEKVFVFETVLQNEGEGYDAGSGIFTAPVNGDYLFVSQMCVTPRNYIYVALVVDKVEQMSTSLGSTKYTCTTPTWLVRLHTGARVWLKSKRSNSVASQDNYQSNTFSGILLKSN